MHFLVLFAAGKRTIKKLYKIIVLIMHQLKINTFLNIYSNYIENNALIELPNIYVAMVCIKESIVLNIPKKSKAYNIKKP